MAGCTAYFTWRRRGLPPSKKKRRTDKPRYKVDRHMVHVVSTGDEWEEVRPKVEADLKILKVRIYKVYSQCKYIMSLWLKFFLPNGHILPFGFTFTSLNITNCSYMYYINYIFHTVRGNQTREVKLFAFLCFVKIECSKLGF